MPTTKLVEWPVVDRVSATVTRLVERDDVRWTLRDVVPLARL